MLTYWLRGPNSEDRRFLRQRVHCVDLSAPPGLPCSTKLRVSAFLIYSNGTNPWSLQITELGQVGEICIAGVQVGAGYWRRPELTAQPFVPSWHPHVDGGRMYCTGDLARWNQMGVLEFVGRVGDQVKIRGNRVELGEGDAALRRVTGVRHAASRVAGENPPVLVGYVVWDQEAVVLSPTEVAAELRQLVPEYMIPSRIVALQALPLSSNGKLDRRALPDLNQI